MKRKLSKQIFSALLAFVMVIGLIPATTIPVYAQNITGMMYASGIRSGEDIVLWGDTTLNMDTDLTVLSIQGDYNLTIQGSGRLTVNGNGNGIDVKSLECYSDLFIQTGWHAIEVTDSLHIQNADTFIIGGIYADGDIEIQSNNATIAGNGNAISSTGGNITLSGSTFDIGANGVAVYAETGNIYTDGAFFINSNESHAIKAERGEVMVIGSLRVTSGETLGDLVGLLIHGIFACNDFTFNGTTLDIKAQDGIFVRDGDINIFAESTKIEASNDYAIQALDKNGDGVGGSVYIDSDYLDLQGPQNNFSNSDDGYACIDANGNVTIYSDEARLIGHYGIRADGDITLDGNFVAKGLVREGLYSKGRIEARGNLSVATDGVYCCLTAQDFTFDGTTLTANGYSGIWGRVTEINADSVVITSDVGSALRGDEVYVTANYLWAENKATKEDSDWKDRGGYQFGISAASKLDLTVEGGTVIGYEDAIAIYDGYNRFDTHYAYVDGSITAVSQIGAGIYVQDGIAGLEGGQIVAVGETHGIYADDVYFEGYSLRVDGNRGIYAKNSVELSGEDIKITAFGERNSGIRCENGYVDLEGKVVINTNGWYGVYTGGDLTLGEGYFEISGPEGNAQAVKTGGTLTMHDTLEIVEPKYGHVNGNEIYGTGDSPAMELEMYSAITDVSLYIDGPRAGKLPTRNASGIYFLDPRCTVDEIIWYEDGEELVSQDAVFRAGHSYTVRIIISADDPYRFLGDVMGKVNDKAVSTGLTDRKIMRLTADLGECPASVDTVELEIKAPVEGNTPSTGVTAGNSTYGVYSRNVRWAVSTDGINFVSMADGEKFVGGKYYRVFMDVTLAGNNYKFPTTTADGTLQPDVDSFVNGNTAVTEKAYDQDPQTVITVYYDFGLCNDYIIEEINIVDVVAPVAGQHPTYTANMFGTGYHIDTTKNSYEDIYWKNPPEKWYYVKNGVQWWDTTTGSYEYVYENDTFISGHTYSCTIYVCVDDGFTFARSNGETLLTGTINGNTAKIVTGWTDSWNTRVTYTFTCSAQEVTSVRVNNLDEPQAGKKPDYTATVAVPENYQLDTTFGVNGIQWYNCEQMEMYPTDTFVLGESYCIAIRLVTANEGLQFADDLEFYINDKVVTPYGYWDDVEVNGNTVTAYYTFRKAASAPVLGYTVSGQATSFNDVEGDISIQLYEYNTDILAYETTVKGNTVDYSIDGVAAGVYTMKVSKANHVTREYRVIVNTGSVVQDVKIHLKGDVNGDGKITIVDVNRANLQFKNKSALSEYELLCADISGDGKVTIVDVNRMNLHFKNKNKLW